MKGRKIQRCQDVRDFADDGPRASEGTEEFQWLGRDEKQKKGYAEIYGIGWQEMRSDMEFWDFLPRQT